MVTAVVAGTLMWAAFVTGLAGLTPTQAKAATGTDAGATVYQVQAASVTTTRPTRTVKVTPHGHVISTPDHGNWN